MITKKGMMRAGAVAVVSAAGLFSFSANAELVGTYEGSDCSGVFGQGFENCKIPANLDPNQTPVIIKYNFEDDGTISVGEDGIQINSALFPTIDGTEFTFSFVGDNWTWVYTPGAGDPVVNFAVAKGGDGFNVFSYLPNGALTGVIYTPGGAGMSHITFYDTGVVPLPAAAWLLGSGLLGLFAVGRRRKAGQVVAA